MAESGQSCAMTHQLLPILARAARPVTTARRMRFWAGFEMAWLFFRQAMMTAALLGALAIPAPAVAASQPLGYASLSRDKVYLREGPTYRHKVLWIYRRKGLPVEVLSKYDVWRRVRMPDGAAGWVHNTMLSDARTVLITAKKPAPLREDAAANSKILALAGPGVIAKLDACQAETCEVTTEGVTGWVDKNNLWGVNAGDIF
jgi:SH3-like domain-containing protein